MKKKNFTLFAVLSFVFLLVFPGGISADTAQNYDEVMLTPQVNPDTVLERVVLKLEPSNNSQTVEITGERVANGELEAHSVTVDLDKKTYSVKKLTNQQIENLGINKMHTDISRNNLGNISRSSSILYHSVARVKMFTVDPVYIRLNSTELAYSWYELQNHAFGFNWRELNTWDANPSTAGTRWYLVNKNYTSGLTAGYQSADAQHVNYDFLNGLSGTTYATHHITIVAGHNQTYTYNLSMSKSGVAGHLLNYIYTTS